MDRPAILGGVPVRPQGPPAWPRGNDEISRALRDLIETGDWGRYHGPHLPAFSKAIADFHGAEHVHLCSSGTVALELALIGVGVHPGDEVIQAAYDFKANFQNVLHLHAVPVLVDVNANDCQLDVSRVEAAITEKTRAIQFSHLHGGIVDAPALRAIADRRGIALVEDACQATGATVFGRRAGMWGDVGILSFGGSKLVTSGRGGAVMSNDATIFERIKRYAIRGDDAYPLSEMHAAILLPQVNQLDQQNARRAQNVAHLCSKLSEINGLRPFQLPSAAHLKPAYYKRGFHFDPSDFGGLPRERFVEAIKAEGIALDVGFRANHLIHATRRFKIGNELVEATKADATIVALFHPVLDEDEGAIDQIVNAIQRVRKHAESIMRSP